MSTEAPTEFFHPLTGEPLLDDRALALAIRDTDQHVAREVAKTYAGLRPVQDALQVLRQHVKVRMPASRYRSETQAKVARCPRCGSRLE